MRNIEKQSHPERSR